MKLSEIKKLSKKEFAERYPFVQMRTWPNGELAFNNETKEPCLEFYVNDWYGWSDILLCWAEKVKPIFDTMSKEEQDKFYISQLKEKYGDMRLYLSYYPSGEYQKISDYTRMVEYISTYTCLQCGHISKSSNGKKLITWRSKGGWVSYYCKDCAREFMFKNAKYYSRKPGLTNKALFDKEYVRKENDWFCRCGSYFNSKETMTVYDARELLEGVY